MGKGTDKLYITASEWSSADAFSASAGANVARNGYTSSTSTNTSSNPNLSRPRLPYNFCALTLQPVPDDHAAVCTPSGTVYDHAAILNWLAKHSASKSASKNGNGSGSESLSSASSSNPVDPNGPPLRAADLVRLNFTRNDDNEIVDPVTYRPFTQGTRVVALRHTGNVFARETVERLNVKAKHWQDLVSDEPFTRADIIGLQEEEQRAQDADGKGEKVERAKEAVARARAERENKSLPGTGPSTGKSITSTSTSTSTSTTPTSHSTKSTSVSARPKSLPYNAAVHTTGKAAASFTSTGLTPHTSNERAILTDEEYMLRPRRVKAKGYARIATNVGDLSVELQPEYAPKAVWNFVQLAKKGYYKDVIFHRNIRGFMIQTGDPTGTGRGGTSIWNKPFADEFDGPLTHDSRGILSMANKGKNTNTSQFFITYRPAKHLDNKHVVFGKVVAAGEGAGSGGGGSGGGSGGSGGSGSGSGSGNAGNGGNGGNGAGESGLATLTRLEQAPTDEKDKPTERLFIRDIVVYVDPFEEFLRGQGRKRGIVGGKADVGSGSGNGHGHGHGHGYGKGNGNGRSRSGNAAGAAAGAKRFADGNRIDDVDDDSDDDDEDNDDDQTTTWTGRKLHSQTNGSADGAVGAAAGGAGGAGIGKYLKAAMVSASNGSSTSMSKSTPAREKRDGKDAEAMYADELAMPPPPQPPPSKKIKSSGGGGGGFGNFDNW